jgi:hypothetical protein
MEKTQEEIKMKEIHILPLAYTPQNHTDIVDWRPFGQDTLGEIVNDFNLKCYETHIKLGWSPDDINQIVDKMDIIRYDLNKLGKLSSDDFETIQIIFADLDVAYEKIAELGWVRTYMGRRRKRYYLNQVSERTDSESLTDFFKGATITPYPLDPPHIFFNQKEFEKFLFMFCLPVPPLRGAYWARKNSLFSPNKERGVDRKDYVEAISEVKSDVQHEAIVMNLSKNETTALARLAVQQEIALRNVSNVVQTQPHQHVVMNFIRKPIRQIAGRPFQKSRFKPVELVGISPNRPVNGLSSQQRSILRGMGIKNERYTSVFVNTPYAQNLVKNLGNSVKVSKLSANLPSFITKK